MIDIRVGDKFTEEMEHQDTTYVITKIEQGRIFAKEIINEKMQRYGAECSFSEDELLHGNTFCSYWFHQRKENNEKC